MLKQIYNVIGVMSGTSLDGVDLAHIHFTTVANGWDFKILESETVAYSSQWFNKFKNAVQFSNADLQLLDKEYTKLLAEIINNFIAANNIESLDAVCSHGHTILHQPKNGFTLQIGNLPELTQLINQQVVCDFRVQDVKLGGQGAPLVPIGDQILFSKFEYCLNLGGFSNVSFVENGVRIAFDISPVNTVLNFYANQVHLDYDDKGALAKSGKLHKNLFDALNALPYYQSTYPKSLGFEFVRETILPLIEKYPSSIEDKMHTFTIHVAHQIAKVLLPQKAALFVTGGGAYNDFLIEQIQKYLPEMEIIIPDKKILEYKEALIFGLLGVLRLRGEINVLSSVTGAKENHSSGKIYKNH
jgi:anhydro-N-acetylmuramic acid kinase